jgi:hypothetical protein
MIQTYTFHVPAGIGGAEAGIAAMRETVGQLVKFQHVLRGFRAEPVPGDQPLIEMRLRVAGINRWNIAADAKRLSLLIARRSGVVWKQVQFITLITEPTRRDLQVGQGRTERSPIPRSQRQADGSPWDHVAWWGDDVSS